MASSSRLLNLPSELRDLIYEYVAVDTGLDLFPQYGGKPTSCTPLSLLSRQLHDEYEAILYTSSPIVRAYVRDFDFTHVITFLDTLNLRQKHRQPANVLPLQSRKLHIILSLTPSSPSPARRNLDKLYQWLVKFSEQENSHITTAFETTYFVHQSSINDEKNAVAPVTLMRIIDEMYCDWFLKTLPGTLKDEIRKVCDCLGEVEMDINRRRSVPQSVGFDDADAAIEVDAAARFG